MNHADCNNWPMFWRKVFISNVTSNSTMQLFLVTLKKGFVSFVRVLVQETCPDTKPIMRAFRSNYDMYWTGIFVCLLSGRHVILPEKIQNKRVVTFEEFLHIVACYDYCKCSFLRLSLKAATPLCRPPKDATNAPPRCVRSWRVESQIQWKMSLHICKTVIWWAHLKIVEILGEIYLGICNWALNCADIMYEPQSLQTYFDSCKNYLAKNPFDGQLNTFSYFGIMS